jgi:uncharacterized membrane protein
VFWPFLVLGSLAGLWLGHGLSGIVGGALVGGALGLIANAMKPRHAAPGTDAARIAALEQRVQGLEAAMMRLVAEPAAPAVSQPVAEPRTDTAAEKESEAAPPSAAKPPMDEPRPAVSADAMRSPGVPPPMPSYGARGAAAPSVTHAQLAPRAAAGSVASAASFEARVRRWLTEGNLLARLGVVVLFFGVAFLLRYFAEHFTVPIEARLAAVAAVGVALVVLGARLARARPAFGLSVQGAGCGVLYLTTFAAFRLYGVLAPGVAMASLVAVAALTVWLAVRHDSQPLAALAIAGGFLAPMLVGGSGSPIPLFAWFACLNAAVVALAWRHSWRALNVVGFAFTFLLALGWGYRFYRPEWFAIVEPFLVLFFALYVAIAVLYAKQAPLVLRAPVDGLLVFGVPLVGFALQFSLVRDTRYGAAWSALALAAVYAALFAAMRKRAEPGLAVLARAFGALAIVFVTVAIPNALDAHWTSAWWALEAALVYWIGCRQAQPLARAFALLLQFAAAVVFLGNREHLAAIAPFANAAFTGSTMIALAAGATAWLADREPALPAGERITAPVALAWSIAWWLVGGIREIELRHGGPELPALALAWCAGSAALALALQRLLRWPRLAWAAAPLLPALVVASLTAIDRERTTLLHAGVLVWPSSFAVHWALLRLADREDAAPLRVLRRDSVHALSALVLVGWLAWEASEWTGRATDPHTVWIACAAAWPAIVLLWLSALPAASTYWPMVAHARAYRSQAGAVVAFALFAWIVIVNVLSPGDSEPLPYVPALNPLDVTVLLALVTLGSWTRCTMSLESRDRYALLAVVGFVALNGAVLRTAHHLGGIGWSLRDLLASRPLQAALTLTWSVTALGLMLFATHRRLRAWWSAGAALLAIVVGKLFLLDLATLSGLPRVVAFLGVGVLLLIIGYFAPFPPARDGSRDRPADARQGGS